MDITLPQSVDDTFGLKLADIGKHPVKCISAEVKMTKAEDGQMLVLEMEVADQINTTPIFDYRSLPRPKDVEGMKGTGEKFSGTNGYIDAATGQNITADQCAKRVRAGMAAISQVVRAFGITYTNKDGKSTFNAEELPGKICPEAEIVVKEAQYKDGNAHIPCTDPTLIGTEADPNYGREKWPEGRLVRLPALPTEEEAKKKKK